MLGALRGDAVGARREVTVGEVVRDDEGGGYTPRGDCRPAGCFDRAGMMPNPLPPPRDSGSSSAGVSASSPSPGKKSFSVLPAGLTGPVADARGAMGRKPAGGPGGVCEAHPPRALGSWVFVGPWRPPGGGYIPLGPVGTDAEGNGPAGMISGRGTCETSRARVLLWYAAATFDLEVPAKLEVTG